MSPSLPLTACCGMAPPHRGPDVGFSKGREEGRSLGHPLVRGKKNHQSCVEIFYAWQTNGRLTLLGIRGTPQPWTSCLTKTARLGSLWGGGDSLCFALVLHKVWRKSPEAESRLWQLQFGADRVVRASTWPARHGQQRTKGQAWR